MIYLLIPEYISNIIDPTLSIDISIYRYIYTNTMLFVHKVPIGTIVPMGTLCTNSIVLVPISPLPNLKLFSIHDPR